MPPSLFCPDTTWTGTQILLSEQHCALCGLFCAQPQPGSAFTESLPPLGQRYHPLKTHEDNHG